ncbi:TonB-dependent receptor plug domain-containing protein [Paucibacter soli]|uniref:TonB-dependent receptor plug domain-containing protein n=1 Tax=Paucibacter soli TaxID=3133433 RepID=UPI0030A08BF8
MRRKRCLGLLGLGLWAGAALAQHRDEELALAYGEAATVSIATGSSQPLRRAPAVASVITAADIVAMGATNLDQVLASVPGLHVSVNAINYAAIYSLRGLYSAPTNPHVLLLLDGVPMKGAYSGDKGTSWTGLPLEYVARIEVIRGPGSALYGADAFAGVINVVSKSAADIGGSEVGIRLGAFGSHEAWAQHGGSVGPLQLVAYAHAGRSDGQRELIAADAASRLDKLFGTHASRAPGPVNTFRRELDLGLKLNWGDWHLNSSQQWQPRIGTGAGVNSALDPDSYTNSRRSMFELGWTSTSADRDWLLGASLSHTRYTEQTPAGLMLFPPGTRIGPNLFPDGMRGGPWRWDRQTRVSVNAGYAGWQGHALRVGLGSEDIDLYASRTYKNFLLSPTGVPIPTGPVIEYSAIQPHIPPARRRNNFVFVQDEWQLAPDWALTLGLRQDRYSDLGSTLNPRLALVWDAAYNLTVKLLHGQAFRAPGFNEQYTVNPVSTGNPQLKPERIATDELALDWQVRSDLQFKLNVYRFDMRDQVRVVANPAPATGASYQNLGRLRGQGLEMEVHWQTLRQLQLTAQLSLQHTLDVASGTDAGYAPHHHLFARADWRLTGVYVLGAQLNAVGGRARAAGDARPPVADYRTVDLQLRHGGEQRGLAWALALRNALDAKPREPSLPGGTLPGDLPLAGRSWSVEGSWRF